MPIRHIAYEDAEIRSKIRTAEICFAGNRKLKIYGKLSCRSGKRMLRQNRVFFASEKQALLFGYRPCGHCMRAEFVQWKNTEIKQM
ncbi:Ada metal-binding domain-containing protein [Sphingobacterium spiritivorum]|uniref:Ada metal-binding domain-containing protein n=1 Tax=Sphingobacterium spiritivorum TaxID=258 RepID=UPI003DA45161